MISDVEHLERVPAGPLHVFRKMSVQFLRSLFNWVICAVWRLRCVNSLSILDIGPYLMYSVPAASRVPFVVSRAVQKLFSLM